MATELQPHARVALRDNDKENIPNEQTLNGASGNHFVWKEKLAEMKTIYKFLESDQKPGQLARNVEGKHWNIGHKDF